MRSFFKALLIVPLVLVAVLFAVANRQSVLISLDPISRDIPLYALDAPLFAVILAALTLGIVIGGFASWLAQGKHRKAKRALGKEAERLRAETASLRSMIPDATTLASLPIRQA